MKFDKTRVYTAFNADEVKVGSKGYFADSISVLKKKVKDGDELLTLTKIFGEESATRFSVSPVSSYILFYFVEEPEEKIYRPYKDTSEITGHALFDEVIDTDDVHCAIVAISKACVYIPTHGWVDMEHLYNFFRWSDNSPCGVEEQGTNEKD